MSVDSRRDVGGTVAVFEGVDEAVGLLMTTTGGASGECLGGENTSFRAGCCILLCDGGCSGVVAVGVPLTGGRTLFSTDGEPLSSLWEGDTAGVEGDNEVGEAPWRG